MLAAPEIWSNYFFSAVFNLICFIGVKFLNCRLYSSMNYTPPHNKKSFLRCTLNESVDIISHISDTKHIDCFVCDYWLHIQVNCDRGGVLPVERAQISLRLIYFHTRIFRVHPKAGQNTQQRGGGRRAIPCQVTLRVPPVKIPGFRRNVEIPLCLFSLNVYVIFVLAKVHFKGRQYILKR